ncbi:hypothetical protein [Thermococcus alcaliphilus]|uniref:hypothetical protein n=1 Tax=Thermococcus alcaliphilus TaxID=139207 RepID=UPI0020913807|nr:hypothetical protein [Thermococcus alcaliphilus]MCO6040812.1 hypothetical protein [Thermococcus alcaliphilus]
MKKGLSFLLITLLLASAFSTYSWWQCKEKNKEMLKDTYTKFEINRWELEHIGASFEYLLQNNASNEVIFLYAVNYRDHVYVVKNLFEFLWSHSKDEREKFWKLRVAMSNLEVFLNSAAFKPHEERKMMLSENVETLKQFDILFKELNKYRDPFDIPDELAEKAFNLSKQLKW